MPLSLVQIELRTRSV